MMSTNEWADQKGQTVIPVLLLLLPMALIADVVLLVGRFSWP
jgi:hypothetical protein